MTDCYQLTTYSIKRSCINEIEIQVRNHIPNPPKRPIPIEVLPWEGGYGARELPVIKSYRKKIKRREKYFKRDRRQTMIELELLDD